MVKYLLNVKYTRRPTPARRRCSSPVVTEFEKKLAKAGSNPDHDAVIELEQAGDSAKTAAEADLGLAADVRESVLAAHLAIRKLKAGA